MKNVETKNTKSAFNKVRQHSILLYMDETHSATTRKFIIAESEKSYKFSDDSTMTKAKAKELQVRNVLNDVTTSIDYNYDTIDSMKYNHVQHKLANALSLDKSATIKDFENLFSVLETTKSVNITLSNSTLLNRANCIEVMLSLHDYNAVKDAFETYISSFSARKYKNCIIKDTRYNDYAELLESELHVSATDIIDSKLVACIKLMNLTDIALFNELTTK